MPKFGTLKACPFCDSDQLELVNPNYAKVTGARITCLACGTYGPIALDEVKARERWNARTKRDLLHSPGVILAGRRPIVTHHGSVSTLVTR